MRMINAYQFQLMLCGVPFGTQVLERINLKMRLPVGGHIRRRNDGGHDPHAEVMPQQKAAALFGRAFYIDYQFAKAVVVYGYELRNDRFHVINVLVSDLL